MGRFTPVVLVLATLVAGTAPFAVGCEKEKSGVEKRAEEMAASASAEKAAKSASASQVDPAEAKYRERKKALEQTVTDLKADEGKLMAKDPTAIAGVLRRYFEPGEAGDKLSKELEAKRRKDGTDGYRIKKAEAAETRLSGNMEDAEVDVMEEAQAKGLSACLLYTQKWHWNGDKWLFHEQKSVKKIDCPA
ncbi:MAG: hypothetical protein ACXVEF_13995 [Polyangiales bacterium]